MERGGESASRARSRSTPPSTSRHPGSRSASTSCRGSCASRPCPRPPSGRCFRSTRATAWPRRPSRWRCSTPSCAPPACRSAASSAASPTPSRPGSPSASRARSHELLDVVERATSRPGYRRVKLKIEPGWDLEPVEAVRDRFGDELMLQVDANARLRGAPTSIISPGSTSTRLLLIEQPLDEEDLLGHAQLARRLDDAGLPRRVDRLGPRRAPPPSRSGRARS